MLMQAQRGGTVKALDMVNVGVQTMAAVGLKHKYQSTNLTDTCFVDAHSILFADIKDIVLLLHYATST